MKWIKYLLWIALLVPVARANVVISQVLYDPAGTESGGEAVELRNDGSSAVDISGWVLETENSASDATLPENTILQPGSTFLIADEGWDDNKDDSSWRSADYEETITLGNKDSGIALLANGTIIDAVGWGSEAGIEGSLYEGTPAALVAAGNALVRKADTDDNSEDFAESAADFQEGIPVPITADIIITAPVIEVSKSLNIVPEGVLSVKNNGQTAVSIKLVFNDLKFGNNTIPKNAIVVDNLEFTVQPLSEHTSEVSLRIPAGTVPGKYTSTLRVITSGS